MKKYLRMALCFMLAVVLLAGLVGCKQEAKYETYYFYEMTDDGEKFTASDLQAELDAEDNGIKLEEVFYLHMYEDGTALMCSLGKEEKMCYNDTEIWAAEDETVRARYTRAGDTITIFEGTAVITYKKK